MKVIERSVQLLPESASRVANAVQAAAGEVSQQGRGFAATVASTATGLQEGLGAVASRMGTLPGLLNPAPVVASCTDVLAQASRDVRELASSAAAVPSRLGGQATAVEPVLAQTRQAAAAVLDLPQSLAGLAPDLREPIAFVTSLPSRAQALGAQAAQALELLKVHGQQLRTLADSLAALQSRPQDAPAAAEAAKTALQAQARDLHGQTLEQLQALRRQVAAGVADLQGSLNTVQTQASASLTGAGPLLRSRAQTMVAPLLGATQLVSDVRTALAEEAQACDALLDECLARLQALVQRLREPAAVARAKADAVADQLAQAGADIEALLKNALAPLDSLGQATTRCTDAMQAAVQVTSEEIKNVQSLLGELVAEAEAVKPRLQTLPAQFEPVRTHIAQASALLLEIKGSIPAFVAQADRALSSAASELDQAEQMCNRAIEVCTRYMMKVPPLMLARTLFVGVKAMVPGVKGSIAQARQAVQTAGQTSTGVLDKALGLVRALEPLLDQALAKLQTAINQLLTLIARLQDATQAAAKALDAVPPPLAAGVDKASTAVQQVLAQVRAQADACVARLQCEVLVRRLQSQFSDLLDRTLAPIWAQLDTANAPVENAVSRAKVGLADAAAALDSPLQALASQLQTAHAQALQPLDALEQLLAQTDQRWAALSDAARSKVDAAAEQAMNLLDQAIVRLGGQPSTPSSAGADEVLAKAAELEAQADAAGLSEGAPQPLLSRFEGVMAEADDLSDAMANSGSSAPGSLAGWAAEAEAAQAVWSDDLTQADEDASRANAALLEKAEAAAQEVEVAVPPARTEPLADEMESGLQEVQAQAQAGVDEAQAALDALQTELESARDLADSATAGFAESAAEAEAACASQWAEAEQAARQAQQAEADLQVEIATAQATVDAAASEAAAETQSLKDEAQAELDAAAQSVNDVQSQVQAARSDVIQAEAIVDAEVVKAGGESLQPAAGAEGASAAATEPATAGEDAPPAAGPTAAADLKAEAAARNETDPRADQPSDVDREGVPAADAEDAMVAATGPATSGEATAPAADPAAATDVKAEAVAKNRTDDREDQPRDTDLERVPAADAADASAAASGPATSGAARAPANGPAAAAGVKVEAVAKNTANLLEDKLDAESGRAPALDAADAADAVDALDAAAAAIDPVTSDASATRATDPAAAALASVLEVNAADASALGTSNGAESIANTGAAPKVIPAVKKLTVPDTPSRGLSSDPLAGAAQSLAAASQALPKSARKAAKKAALQAALEAAKKAAQALRPPGT